MAASRRLVRGPQAAEAWALLLAAVLPALLLFKRGLAETTLGLFVLVGLALAWRYRESAWLRQPWLYAAWGLSAVLLLLAPFSINPGESAQAALISWRWPVFAALLAWFFLARPQRLRVFEIGVLVVLVFVMLDGLWQYLTGTDVFGLPRYSADRLTGPFNDPLIGTFTDRLWFIALALLWFVMLRRHAALAVVGLLAASAAGALFIFLTGERAAFLVFVLGTGLVALGVFVRLPRWRWPLVGAALATTVAVAALAATQSKMVDRTVHSTLDAIVHLDQNVYGLNLITGWEQFRENPLTGVGARQFQAYCQARMPEALAAYRELGIPECVIHPHNLYMGMLAEGGLVAFTLFVLMLVLLLVAFFHQERTGSELRELRAFFASSLLLVTFWPAQPSMEYFNGWTAAVVWMGIGWGLARTRLAYAETAAGS